MANGDGCVCARSGGTPWPMGRCTMLGAVVGGGGNASGEGGVGVSVVGGHLGVVVAAVRVWRN